MGFLVVLEGVAGGTLTETAVAMVAIANKLRVGVICKSVNGSEMFAHPNDDPAEVLERWRRGARMEPPPAARGHHHAFATDAAAFNFLERLLMRCDHDTDLITLPAGGTLAERSAKEAIQFVRQWWAEGILPPVTK